MEDQRMQRRELIRHGVIAMVAATAADHAQAAGTVRGSAEDSGEPPRRAPTRRSGTMIAVMADLLFPAEAATAGEAALAALAAATRTEPGCRRYVVGRDVTGPGLFHLSEIWDDLAALAAHFRTRHMAAFQAEARILGLSTRFLKRIEIADIADLDLRALARG